MSMGSMYVKLNANAANGIMNLNISDPTTSGGGQENGYWLYWNEIGFTGNPWNNYWSETPLPVTWPAFLGADGTCPSGGRHTDDAAGLQEHISQGHADDLNAMLGSWDFIDKSAFIGKYGDDFLADGCLDPH